MARLQANLQGHTWRACRCLAREVAPARAATAWEVLRITGHGLAWEGRVASLNTSRASGQPPLLVHGNWRLCTLASEACPPSARGGAGIGARETF